MRNQIHHAIVGARSIPPFTNPCSRNQTMDTMCKFPGTNTRLFMLIAKLLSWNVEFAADPYCDLQSLNACYAMQYQNEMNLDLFSYSHPATIEKMGFFFKTPENFNLPLNIIFKPFGLYTWLILVGIGVFSEAVKRIYMAYMGTRVPISYQVTFKMFWFIIATIYQSILCEKIIGFHPSLPFYNIQGFVEKLESKEIEFITTNRSGILISLSINANISIFNRINRAMNSINPPKHVLLHQHWTYFKIGESK